MFCFFLASGTDFIYMTARGRLFLELPFLKNIFYTNVLRWFQKPSMHLSHYEALLIFFLKAPLAHFHASDILMSLFRLSNSGKDDSTTRENFATKKETSSPSDLKSPLGWERFCSADPSPVRRE